MSISRFQTLSLFTVGGLALLTMGGGARDAEASGADFSGTYVCSLPERAEIMTIQRDGTATMTLSDQVTFGAGGFTFSDSLGAWRVTGPNEVSIRMTNLNFDLTGAAPAFSGIAVVDYSLHFSQGKDTFTASCDGAIFAPGDDPLSPASTPVATFDCAYLAPFQYRRVTVP